jgi:hypothetical protein
MHTQTHEARLHTIVRSDGTQRDRMTLVDPKLDNPPVDLPAPTGGLWTEPPPHRAAACFEDDSDSSMRGAGVAFAAAGIIGACLVIYHAHTIATWILEVLK